MGLFATLAFSDGRWTRGRPTSVPFMLVDVHDGDVATVDYRFADASGGRFFLGWEPRIYFEQPDAADPVDVGTEATGFAHWAHEAVEADVDPDDVRQLMADPGGAPPPPESTVVETVDRLVALAGLPPVDWPTDDDAPAG